MNFLKVPKKYLFSIAAIIWGCPGIELLIKGTKLHHSINAGFSITMAAISILILLVFVFVFFKKAFNSTCQFINSKDEKDYIWYAFDIKGWLILVIMIGLAIASARFHLFSTKFLATFFPGLATALIIYSILFFRETVLFNKKNKY